MTDSLLNLFYCFMAFLFICFVILLLSLMVCYLIEVTFEIIDEFKERKGKSE